MMVIGRIVLVGHCGFDASSLGDLAQRMAPGATVTTADDDAALAEAGPDTLLLINRALDGWFAAADGVELIRQLNNRDDPPRTMLISNYTDAQSQAQQAGAWPGFGKSELNTAATEHRLRQALGPVRDGQPASMTP